MKHRHLISILVWAAAAAAAHEPADTAAGMPGQHLGELVITAKAPAVRVTPDKTVYDLKSTVMGQSGTMLDALGSIPGVSVSADGAVSLYGNRGAAITVDGKKIYLKGQELANYLRSLPATAVNTVALRTTANARDDASDKSGTIEITTRRERRHGTTLGLNAGVSAWRNLRANGNVSLAWNRGRSELSLICSAFGARQRIHLDIDRHYITDEDRMMQTSGRRRSDNAHTMKLGWVWNFSPRTSLLTSASVSRNCRDERGRMVSDIPSIAEHETSQNHTRSRWNNLMADIYLSHRLGSGAELSGGVNFFRYATRERQLMQSTVPDTLRSHVDGRVWWLIDRVDFTGPITRELKLMAGLKNAFVNIDNSGDYWNLAPEGWRPDAGLSSEFRYRTQSNAIYAQLSWTRGRLSLSAGARLEHERLRGEFSGNETAPDTSYCINTFDLVPTAEARYAISADASVMLSYSRRVERPNYADLNPFVYVFDEYTHSGGNINLRPSVSDNIQAGFAWRGRLQAVMFLTYSDDAIMKSYREISDRRVYVATENLPYFLRAGLRVVLADQPVCRRWNISATASAFYSRYDWMDAGKRETTRRLTPTLSLENRVDLGRGWTAELKGRIDGSMAYGQTVVRPSGSVDAAVRKSLFGRKGSLTLFVRDITASDKTRTSITLGGRTSRFTETEYKRMAGVSFSYKLNTGEKSRPKRRPAGPEELDRL